MSRGSSCRGGLGSCLHRGGLAKGVGCAGGQGTAKGQGQGLMPSLWRDLEVQSLVIVHKCRGKCAWHNCMAQLHGTVAAWRLCACCMSTLWTCVRAGMCMGIMCTLACMSAGLCACVYVCACASSRVCVCVCVCVCVGATVASTGRLNEPSISALSV